jgi:hypothetical protein
MDFYFNELSLTPLSNLATANDVLTKFVHCCTSLQKLGMKSMRFTTDIKNYELLDGYFIYNWLKDKNTDLELTRRFKSISTQSPIIALENKPILEQAQQSDVYVDNKQAIGLSAAFFDKSLSISFLSHPIWVNDSIPAIHTYFDTSNQFKEKTVTVRHVSLLEHLLVHKSWLKNVLPMPQYDFSQPFPFPIISKFMLPVDFYQTTVNLDAVERIAIYTSWAEKIASLNWYEYNPELTKRNSNRDIYHLGEGRNRIYLPVDTQHGRFECCDHQGIHQGEFDFYGNLTKEADKTGKHNIKVK